MSYFILQDEYSISVEKNYLWYDLGGAGAISKEWNSLWNIFSGVSNLWNYKWDILEYISREFNYLWSIGYFVSRGFNYLYEIGLEYGGKIRYNFVKAKATTRFFRGNRNG